MFDKRQLGEKIQYFRDRKRYSTYALSIQIDVGDSNLGKIERGEQNITASIAIALANEFGLTISDLLYDEASSLEDFDRIQNYLDNISSISDFNYLYKLLLRIKST